MYYFFCGFTFIFTDEIFQLDDGVRREQGGLFGKIKKKTSLEGAKRGSVTENACANEGHNI